MLKRIEIGELPTGAVFYINGRRYKCYGRAIRDNHMYVVAYEDRLNGIRKLNYLNPDMEVMVNEQQL